MASLLFATLVSDGNIESDEDIQPVSYRAPEVILEMKWSYTVNILNAGVMLWRLVLNDYLFKAHDPEIRRISNSYRLAEMISYLGQPPPQFLSRPGRADKYFDEEKKLRDHWELSTVHSFEAFEDERFQGEEKELSIQLIKSMVKWDPAERKTAKELVDNDPWLNMNP